jgi:hypothetical protein
MESRLFDEPVYLVLGGWRTPRGPGPSCHSDFQLNIAFPNSFVFIPMHRLHILPTLLLARGGIRQDFFWLSLATYDWFDLFSISMCSPPLWPIWSNPYVMSTYQIFNIQANTWKFFFCGVWNVKKCCGYKEINDISVMAKVSSSCHQKLSSLLTQSLSYFVETDFWPT